ncbi:phosphonate C-P lyase system protein PhnG [Salinicoccus roseus]|uniref:phosphonate C-P lyase system protein PhnG n=1 Tax=Salinicoccus roseus TaxID=45670 RepID=UPI001EF4A7E7|nr:phosphonate C-P lyase system protein PhnG [Salinicoccus roseus]MCG7332462.1 phosphonate C-P lyase system protein PhnG [Salinicoccus roseus]
MNKKRWTSLFIKYGKEAAADFLDTYRNAVPFQIVSEPTEGLTMITVREHAENSLSISAKCL